jgi:hypothetical protein
MENAISGYKAYARVLLSQWFVQSDLKALDVAKHLLDAIDKDDRLLVTEVTRKMALYNTRLTDEQMGKWVDAARD